MIPPIEQARWLQTDSDVETLVAELLEQPDYAIDTEFLRERTYYPQLALVQIAWDGGLVLLDPLAVDIAPLRQVFESDVLAIFHAADQDLEVLDYACGAVPNRIYDTQIAAGFVGFSTPSLSTLAERILSVKLSKGDRLTDWTQRPLTKAQRTYAASDVVYLHAMQTAIDEQLQVGGRLPWAEEEFELLRTRPRGQSQAERAWWRLKDGRVLRGKDRLVAQQICVWREKRSQFEDKPVRFVLPDLAVVSIAQSKPSRVDELATQRGIDGRYIKGGIGQEIISVVQDALQMPNSALCLPEPDDFDRRLRPALTLISAWIAQLARDAKIDSSLLATRADLVSFLRGDATARLRMGWRAEVVGTAVQQLMSGEAALAFDASGGLLLEGRSGQLLATSLAVPTAEWAEIPEIRED